MEPLLSNFVTNQKKFFFFSLREILISLLHKSTPRRANFTTHTFHILRIVIIYLAAYFQTSPITCTPIVHFATLSDSVNSWGSDSFTILVFKRVILRLSESWIQ